MKRKTEILSRKEVLRLLATFTETPIGIRNRAMVTLMWRGGLRSKEIVSLKRKDVGKKKIHVREAKGDKERYVPLDAQAMAMIRHWIAVRKNVTSIKSKILFCTLKGKTIDTSYLRHMLRRKAKETKIQKRVHPHCLRHLYASELDAERVPLGMIQQLLGHESIQTTSIYIARVGAQDLVDRIAERPTWELAKRKRKKLKKSA